MCPKTHLPRSLSLSSSIYHDGQSRLSIHHFIHPFIHVYSCRFAALYVHGFVQIAPPRIPWVLPLKISLGKHNLGTHRTNPLPWNTTWRIISPSNWLKILLNKFSNWAIITYMYIYIISYIYIYILHISNIYISTYVIYTCIHIYNIHMNTYGL